MNTKILRCIVGILFLGLLTASDLFGANVQSNKPTDPVSTEKPNSTVTISGIIYKGPNSAVAVNAITYKGTNPLVTVSNIVYEGKGTKVFLQKNQQEKQIKVLLEFPKGQTFKIGAMIPLKVNLKNFAETKPKPMFEFQRLNGKIWRRSHGQRVMGNITKQFRKEVTLMRHIKFRKAGVYRLRCQINKGVWSAWSNPVKVVGPIKKVTPAVNSMGPAGAPTGE